MGLGYQRCLERAIVQEKGRTGVVRMQEGLGGGVLTEKEAGGH